MNTIFLALGSNVGDKMQNINNAISLLSKKIVEVKLAPIYETKAVGYTDQDNFMNTALLGKTRLSPLNLLNFVKQIETEVGRIKRFRWGPREIDIDIIFYNDLCSVSDKLTIPHQLMHTRDFVLKPLLTLDKNFVHQVCNKTLEQLYLELPKNEQSVLEKML